MTNEHGSSQFLFSICQVRKGKKKRSQSHVLCIVNHLSRSDALIAKKQTKRKKKKLLKIDQTDRMIHYGISHSVWVCECEPCPGCVYIYLPSHPDRFACSYQHVAIALQFSLQCNPGIVSIFRTQNVFE